MKTALQCVPCFVKQAYDAGLMAGADEKTRAAIMRETLRALAELEFELPPPVMGRAVHAIVKRVGRIADPYAGVKEEFNREALALYPELKRRVEQAPDRLEAAVRLAIAGNIIDFGVAGHAAEIDLRGTIADTLRREFAVNDLEYLRAAAAKARSVLYLLDNAGEIVFDRLLIEELGAEKITAAVKSSPIINDATLADAQATGLDRVVRVIENGLDAPGTLLDECAPEFRRLFDAADLVVAKGQGNYETLSAAPRGGIVFLLKAKCRVVAEDLGCELGGLVAKAKIQEG